MEGENQYKKGLWTEEEDKILMDYVKLHGKGQWNRAANKTGLKRCGKSCRLRWMNYLCPNVKRGSFSDEEDDLIIRLHRLLGNRWSLIAGRVPGRTDNQVKNYWNSHLSKKLGLNKKKTTSGVSAQTKSRVVKTASADPPTSLNSDPYCFSSSGSDATETQTSKITPKAVVVVEASHTQTHIQEVEYSDDGFLDSFWASSEELELSMTSNLIELCGEYSFDLLGWNGL